MTLTVTPIIRDLTYALDNLVSAQEGAVAIEPEDDVADRLAVELHTMIRNIAEMIILAARSY